MFTEMLRKRRNYFLHESGVAAVILAMILPALVASAGVAVDIATAYNSQSRLSNALDKAVLATASSTSSGLTNAQLQARFLAFFNANYPTGTYGTPFNVSLTMDGSIMTATASAAVPTTFMQIVGVGTLNVTATSQVVQTLAGVEAVLVLDTTGSMAGNNIAALRTASTTFINTMFSSITDVKYLKIGIVPWSDNVNVGPYGYTLSGGVITGLTPSGQYYGAPFVSPQSPDPYGVSNITYTTDMTSTQWGGCVMEPNAAAITQDYTGVNWKMYRYPPPGHNNCLQYGCINNAYDCENTTYTYACKTYACEAYACAQYNCLTTACECSSGNSLVSGTTCCPNGDSVISSGHCCPTGYAYSGGQCKKAGSTTKSAGAESSCTNQCTQYGNTCVTQGTCATPGTASNGAACTTPGTSHNGAAILSSTCTTAGNASNGAQCSIGTDTSNCLQYSTSPNDGCTSVPVLPMTNDQNALLAEINALPTANNTYPDIGMAWGWRMISPGFPFQEGAAYSDNTWSKTVIMMTDGNATINTVANGEGYYGVTPGISQTTTDQNNKFEQICTNMKAQGIRIYTITFQSAINATTQQYYRNCATNASMYYNAPTNADLATAFQSIATQLSQLHLTQ